MSTAQILHIVPQGTETVNGSDVDIGCQEKVTNVNGVMFCGHYSDPGTSYLTDGITPDIDTSALNWTSQLVTVRKNTATDIIPYDYVVLVFETKNPVNLTSVELDMFICPQWNIGAPNITVYESGSVGYAYTITDDRIKFCGAVSLPQSCHMCSSLSTVRIPLQNTQPSLKWFIVVNVEPDIKWVHIGEVRVLNKSTLPTSESSIRHYMT